MAKSVPEWLGKVGVKEFCIEPVRPWERCVVEGLSRNIRDEMTNGDMCRTAAGHEPRACAGRSATTASARAARSVATRLQRKRSPTRTRPDSLQTAKCRLQHG
jgi:hypothetical protein